jgi:hypothetical protein
MVRCAVREPRQIEDRADQSANRQRNGRAQDESYLADVQRRKAEIGKVLAEDHIACKHEAEKTEEDAYETQRRHRIRAFADRRHCGYRRFNAVVVIAGR